MITLKPEKPICPYCGSDDVVANASASWDKAKQKWICEDIYDKGHSCLNCDSDISFDWVEIKAGGAA